MEVAESERVMQTVLGKIAQNTSPNSLKNNELHSTPKCHGAEVVRQFGVKGARQMALEGYKDLFDHWLPAFRSMKGDPMQIQKTLLCIMSELDDTCVNHRVGYDRAQEAKREAAGLLADFDPEKLKAMCERYNAEGISPGGAADMLALTILIDSSLNE